VVKNGRQIPVLRSVACDAQTLLVSVHQLLESSNCTSPTPQMMADLQSLACALLESLNDKNVALSHQRKTNKFVTFQTTLYMYVSCLFVNRIMWRVTWLVITEVRRASFGWCYMRSTFLQIFIIFLSPEGYQLQFFIPCPYFVYRVWHCTNTGQQCSSMCMCTHRLFAGMWRPWWVLLQHYYVAKITLLCCEEYRALSLHYACTRRLDIILIP